MAENLGKKDRKNVIFCEELQKRKKMAIFQYFFVLTIDIWEKL